MVHKISNNTFYSDAGHGWLKVSLKDLEELGIVDQITPYSYIKGNYAYLEEDADANTFAKAFEKKTGKKVKFADIKEVVETTGRSPIRNYLPYSPQSARRKLKLM